MFELFIGLFLLYISGVIATFVLVAYGAFIAAISPSTQVFESNIAHIGLFKDIDGNFYKTREREKRSLIAVAVFASIFSWFNVVVSIPDIIKVTFVCIKYLTSGRDFGTGRLAEVRETLHSVQLSPEDAVCLFIECNSLMLGRKLTIEEVEDFINTACEVNPRFNKNKVMDVLFEKKVLQEAA